MLKVLSTLTVRSLIPPPLHFCFYSLPKFDHHCGFRVISALMNSTVLSLCHSSETGMPISDDTVTGRICFKLIIKFM